MFKSLRARITGISILISSLALIMLSTAVFMVVRSDTLATIDSSTSLLARTYALNLSDWAQDKRQITHSLGLVIHEPDPSPFLKLAEAAGVDAAFFGKADDSIHILIPRPAGYKSTQRDWYKQAIEAGGPSMTPVYADTASGKLVVSFVEPVVEHGQTVAVLGADLELTSVVQLVDGIRPYNKSFAFLINKDSGNILAHPDSKYTLKPVSNLSPDLNIALLSGLADQNLHALLPIDGVQNMIYAANIPGTPWLLAVSVDYTEAMASLTKLSWLAMVITILGVLFAGLLMAWFVNRQLARLLMVRNALQEIASGDGDLTRRMDDSGQDELTAIAKAFNMFTDKISAVLLRIREASDSIRTAATEIASGSQDLASRTEQQASSLAETAAAMEQLTATVRQNSDSVQQANSLTDAAAQATGGGQSSVQALVATMSDINDKSKQVADILGVIDSIAFQTNILALNAAVEAARAGEQGRGFAVVASEVRALAQRSAGAAREIKTLIDTSVQTTALGNEQATHTGATMQEVVDGISRVTDIMNEINSANREQATGLEEINTAITQMDDVTHQNASLVEESAAAALSLQEQSHTLTHLVAAFRLPEPTMATQVSIKQPADNLPQPSTQAPKHVPTITPTPAKPIAPAALVAPKARAVAQAEDDDWTEF